MPYFANKMKHPKYPSKRNEFSDNFFLNFLFKSWTQWKYLLWRRLLSWSFFSFILQQFSHYIQFNDIFSQQIILHFPLFLFSFKEIMVVILQLSFVRPNIIFYRTNLLSMTNILWARWSGSSSFLLPKFLFFHFFLFFHWFVFFSRNHDITFYLLMSDPI